MEASQKRAKPWGNAYNSRNREMGWCLVDGAKDHRIVMSAAVAASVCAGEVTITDAQAADKSFPSFFKTAIRH